MQKLVFIPSHKSPYFRAKEEPVDVLIDGADTIGSSLMRACVISLFMKKKWDHLIDVRYSRELPPDVNEGDIVIFVKDFEHKDIAVSKEKKCITVYDPVDLPHTFSNNKKFDLMIACSDAYADIMSKKHDVDRSKVITIDVLHTNINRKKVTPRKKDQKVVVGAVNPGSTALLEEGAYKNLLDFSNKNNFLLKNVDTDKKHFSLDRASGEVKNLFECYEDLHIGLALYDQNKLNYDRINQKPSTKVTGYASYGIPVICSYQRALDPIIEQFPEFANFIAKDLEEAKEKLLNLINNFELYEKSKELFSKIGEMFHMDHAYERYINQINDAYSLNEKM
jgi:glycosyltransferase involved in cell wall biosynthesis